MSRFKVGEKVKVKTKFPTWIRRDWLPDEVEYMWSANHYHKGYSVILWHGTLHSVPTKDIFKLPKKRNLDKPPKGV